MRHRSGVKAQNVRFNRIFSEPIVVPIQIRRCAKCARQIKEKESWVDIEHLRYHTACLSSIIFEGDV